MNKLIGTLLITFTTQVLLAQSAKVKKYFKSDNYFLCIKEIESGLHSGTYIENEELVFYLAESYRRINVYQKALVWYNKLKDLSKDQFKDLNYAKVLIHNGKLTQARDFLKTVDKPIIEQKKLLQITERGLHATKADTVARVWNLNQVNSPSDEFGPFILNDTLYFTLNDPGDGKNINPQNGQGYSDLYKVSIITLNKPKKIQGEINSDFNEGTLVYSKLLKLGFFTQCNGYDGTSKFCNIYKTKYYETSGYWSQGELFEAIKPNYDSGHPTLRLTGTTLIFSSNMPGGSGGKDLWKVEFENGIWSKPVNLGDKINSRGDELFPFWDGDSTLYFASDGHYGYGGFDLFKVNFFTQDTVKNLMLPINSTADDFGLITINQDSGLFSSNRPGGVGSDDLYAFKMASPAKPYLQGLTLKITGTIFNKKDKKPIKGAFALIETEEGIKDTIVSGPDGVYQFEANLKNMQDVYVKIIVFKKNYLSDEIEIIKQDLEHLTDEQVYFKNDFYLQTIIRDEIRISNIYYELNKWDIKKESLESLNKLIWLLDANPHLVVQINAHTDVRGSPGFNLRLSQKRAEAVVNHVVKNGIDEKRLFSKGWGESAPFITDASFEQEHEINRRTTFSILNYDEIKGENQLLLDELERQYNEQTKE